MAKIRTILNIKKDGILEKVTINDPHTRCDCKETGEQKCENGYSQRIFYETKRRYSKDIQRFKSEEEAKLTFNNNYE